MLKLRPFPNFAKFSILIVVLLSLAIASVCYGATSLTLAQIWEGLNSNNFAIYNYRLPRTVIAIIIGAMLGVAGAITQGIIKNPLASPDILGINHGAGLAAVILITIFVDVNVAWLPVAALSGGIIAGLFLFILQASKRNASIAITGVAMAALYSSLIDFIVLTQPLEINNALLWLTGSIWGRNWHHVYMLLPSGVLIPVVIWISHRVDILTLGDIQATSLGLQVKIIKIIALFIAILWTSTAVSICGPLSFIGLVSPHVARKIVNSKYIYIIPASMLVGAIILTASDLIARTIDPPIELPAGIMSALVGAPYFIYLLIHSRRIRK